MVFAAGVLTRFDASQGLPYEPRQLTRTIGQTSAPTSQDSIALEGNNVTKRKHNLFAFSGRLHGLQCSFRIRRLL